MHYNTVTSPTEPTERGFELKYAQSFADVVNQISLICGQCRTNQSRSGYFAALYLDVTRRIASADFENRFALGDSIERLDTTFANRYLQSYFAHERGQKTLPLWDRVFEFNQKTRPGIVQHLLASCLVHIGFDLGISVSEAIPKEQLENFRSDFDLVNSILKSSFGDLNASLCSVWPLYRAFSSILGRAEEDAVTLVMDVERDNAWNFALQIAHASTEAERERIEKARTAHIGKLLTNLCSPGPIVRLVETVLARTQSQDVAKNIQILENASPETMPPLPQPGSPKRRVAVLGGGIGSLAAVFQLTQNKSWRQNLEITVYQMGWRLGGKGATGRNTQYGSRIEEHGLHMWFGFYDAAFGIMRQVFAELNRPESHPIRSIDSAFLPADTYTFGQTFNGKQELWHIYWPPNNETPGNKTRLELGDYLCAAVNLFVHLVTGRKPADHRSGDAKPRTLAESILSWMDDFLTPEHIRPNVSNAEAAFFIKLIRGALKLLAFALGDRVQNDLGAYRLWIAADMIGAVITGVLKDELLKNGVNAINNLNWQDWLKKHGIDDRTFDSCMVQVAYDSSFAFYKGKYDMEAGTTLIGALMMFFGYKGSIVYRFAAGTGETIFEPIYECLKERGVRFEFFHKVTDIEAQNGRISSLSLLKQATVRGEYDPFVSASGLKCWPQEPNYDQLVEGELLRSQGIDLESHWTSWQGVDQLKLLVDRDFDDVVCGVSIEGLKHLTKSLKRQNPAWETMLDKVKTTPTMAFQLWMKPTLEGCGWWQPDTAILSCNGEPLDSYADLSCTIAFEGPQNGVIPGSAAYFCGAMIDEPDAVPPESDRDYPRRARDRVRQYTVNYINTKLQASWPHAFDAHGQFRWDLLVGPADDVIGEARLESQFWKANIDPSERYVLSVTGSSQFRLSSGSSGFTNFFLAGDWTDNGIVNAGCMEAGALSGIQAAQALLERLGGAARPTAFHATEDRERGRAALQAPTALSRGA